MQRNARELDRGRTRWFKRGLDAPRRPGEEGGADTASVPLSLVCVLFSQAKRGEKPRAHAVAAVAAEALARLARATAARFPLRMVFRILDADLDEMEPVERFVCETHIIDTMEIFGPS